MATHSRRKTTAKSRHSESDMYPALCHASALAGFVIPFGNIIGPLLVWMLLKDRDPRVETHGREALNFQISMTLYYAIGFVLVFVLIGIPLLLAVAVLDILFTIKAVIVANKGEEFRYPLSIRFVK